MGTGSRSSRTKWLISERLWQEIEPLLPRDTRRRRRGRPRVSDRSAMEGIFFVLKTGCPWKALDVTGLCSGSVAHQRFQVWRRAGVFRAFWQRGLQAYDAAKGIDWRWLSLDTSAVKAPVAGSKKRAKTPRIVANEAPSEAS